MVKRAIGQEDAAIPVVLARHVVAEECSPWRKPWVPTRPIASPEGA